VVSYEIYISSVVFRNFIDASAFWNPCHFTTGSTSVLWGCAMREYVVCFMSLLGIQSCSEPEYYIFSIYVREKCRFRTAMFLEHFPPTGAVVVL
jgi:hypothetical protein